MRWAQWSFITEVSGIPLVFITWGSAFYMFRSLAPEGELWCLAGQGSWGLSVEVFTSFLNCAVLCLEMRCGQCRASICTSGVPTSGVPIRVTAHPVPDSHVTTCQHLPIPLSARLLLLADCGHTYARFLPPSLALWNQRSTFSAAPV